MQLVCSETTVRQFAVSEFLVRCGVRGDGETAALELTRSFRVGVGSRLSDISAASDEHVQDAIRKSVLKM